jgi:hypothetical protein
MVLNYRNATPKQLLQIVLDENCPVLYKFEAANEYKRRNNSGFWKAIKQEKMKRHMGR